MLNDQSLLRRHTVRAMGALKVDGASVVELGGRKDGAHAKLFRAGGASYEAVGFEGDFPIDLSREHVPLADGSRDVVLISMVLMYLEPEDISFALNEAHRLLKSGGTLFLFEPFLSADTPHHEIADKTRLTMEGMASLLRRHGFSETRMQPLGGAFGLVFTVLRELLPGFLAPVRGLLTRVGAGLDRLSGTVGYFRRRHQRYYVGYFAQARKH